jgi:hypothetical protein
MTPFHLFPQVLPFDPATARERLAAISKDPKDNFIQGKALEFALADHQSKFTSVILTDETKDNQWWDIACPDLKTPMMVDAKSRTNIEIGPNPITTVSYSVSRAEQEKQFKHTGLFVWALYKFDGDVFHREFVLARFKGQEITNPPLLRPSTKERVNCELGFFWLINDLQGRETLALEEMMKLNLI